MTIYEKLMNIQLELKAPKSQYNSFGNYSYRSCEDILTAVKPLLEKHNAVLVIDDNITQLGDRYYVQATATLVDIEADKKIVNDQSSISVSAFAREDESKKGMDLAQITGSVSSYARKYALNGLFCIDDAKDSDFTNKHGKGEGNNTSSKPTQQKQRTSNTNTLKCSRCNVKISASVNNFSVSKFNKSLCMDCQKVEQ